MKKAVISSILSKISGKILLLFVIYLVLKFSSLYLRKMSERLSIAALIIKQVMQS